VDSRADALYDLEPTAFVAARDELARALKAEGDAAGAKAVRALRRPTVAAAALNQVARRHPAAVLAVLEAGEALAAATSPGDLREAGRARREAVQAVVRLVERAHRDAVAATLEAALVAPALVAPALAADVRAGRLAREAEAPATFGFGSLPEPDPVASQASGEAAAPAADVEALEREVAEAAAALELAEATVDAARRTLGQAEERRSDASARLAHLTERLRGIGT
jgi:hypothetical protein